MSNYRLSAARAAFVEQEVEAGGYTNASEYLETLVDAAAQQKLERLLMEGVRSEELAWTPELLQQIRRDANLAA